MCYRIWLQASLLVMICGTGRLVADTPKIADSQNSIDRQAVSILTRECISCHGLEKQDGGLALNDRAGLETGGEHGSLLLRDGKSLLLDRVEHADREMRMPPRRSLPPADIGILKTWIQSGAYWPSSSGDSVREDQMRGDAWSDPNNPIRRLFSGKRLDHWSLKPVSKPSLPNVKNVEWCRNAIDRFVLADWEQAGMQPAPQIADHAFALRSGMDLIGMPLDFESIHDFESSSSPNKYVEWVETLLQSPHFGSHWARMWLDVVRYSDSNGFDWDEFRPEAWRYRDYVVRAMNQDLPFDQFIEQQLAGDELFPAPPRNEEQQRALIATGFLRLGPQDNAASLFNEQDRARAELMADLTETTASAFLGLTFSCCRCHDHKTDAFSQEDHYRLRAFFASCRIPENSSIDLEPVQSAAQSHNAEIDRKVAELNERIAQLMEAVRTRSNEKLSDKQVKERFNSDERSIWMSLDSQVKALNQKKASLTLGLLMTDQRDAQPTFLLSQGDHRLPKSAVTPGFPGVLWPNPAHILESANHATSGRRRTLARWITSPDNPWTARVIVNRLWQNYFGTGIVSTPNDFGVTGSRPSHPELLDYLAAELVENGWSLKHIHRLIVTSNCYRQQPIHRTKADPLRIASLRNGLRRLSAEQLRDSILFAADLLQTPAGGPPVWPEVDAQTLSANPAVLDDNETKTKGWYPSSKAKQTVRSLYLIQKRTIKLPFMETFDFPESSTSCGQRESSLVAPQSLTLMNNELTANAASEIAVLATRRGLNFPWEVVNFCFERILSRRPNNDELQSCLSFLQKHSVPELCLVLLNCNEFAFVE